MASAGSEVSKLVAMASVDEVTDALREVIDPELGSISSSSG